MPVVLCYGDSNLRGFIAGTFNEKTGLSDRYSKNVRWTGILQNQLGSEWHIIEEGLNGRTTALDEITPGRAHRNGLKDLPLFLESHYPIDLVIFMLGTNDCKTQFHKTAKEIATNMKKLIQFVQTSHRGPQGKAPKVLLLASPPLLKNVTEKDFDFDESSIDPSEQLAASYQQLAQEQQCAFLDAALYIKTSKVDGVHLEEKEHAILGKTIANKVLQMFQGL